jgi:hypothetical protein
LEEVFRSKRKDRERENRKEGKGRKGKERNANASFAFGSRGGAPGGVERSESWGEAPEE